MGDRLGMTGDEQGIVEITRDDRDGVDVIQIGGEVDLTNADAVEAAVEATRSASVVLDLTRVAYLDSSGIRAIDRSHRRLVAGSRALLIVSPPETAADWTFRVAGFKSELLVSSLEAALATVLETHGSS
jgi:anti-sigma B factor antagonist